MNVPPETCDYWGRLGHDPGALRRAVAGRLARIATAWELQVVGEPLRGGLTSVVHRVHRRGIDHALKVTPSVIDVGRAEAVALALWSGAGAVRLAGVSLDGEVRLLEWLEEVGADAVTDTQVAGLLMRLQCRDARAAALPPLSARVAQMFGWAERLEQDHVSGEAIRRCARDALALARSSPRPVIVHGDLQPKNLMRRQGEVVAIDPIPAVGDGAFDVALWSLTAPGYADAPGRAARIADVLGQDPARAVAWTGALAAVVAAWPQDEARRRVCAQLCA